MAPQVEINALDDMGGVRVASCRDFYLVASVNSLRAGAGERPILRLPIPHEPQTTNRDGLVGDRSGSPGNGASVRAEDELSPGSEICRPGLRDRGDFPLLAPLVVAYFAAAAIRNRTDVARALGAEHARKRKER